MDARSAQLAGLPDSPVGRQLGRCLAAIASGGPNGADPGQRAPDLLAGLGPDDEEILSTLQRLAARLGHFELLSVDDAAEHSIAASLQAQNGKRWRIDCAVEDAPPHRITRFDWRRVVAVEVAVREAKLSDAAALSEIERRCPIVIGEDRITFDRGDDYFAFADVIDDVCVSLGFVDGVPAGINCGALRRALVNGVERPMMVALHTRILPEYQGKGVWGELSRLLTERYRDVTEGSCGYGALDNVAIQRGFAHVTEVWKLNPVRLHFDCAELAEPGPGRTATPADAARVAEILNGCHATEEMFLPYDAQSLAARLTRAPERYGWERVRLTERAVLGVWPAGDSIEVILESAGRRRVTRRGVVLDYGFLPGAEEELVGLLRGACAWLDARGLDTLCLFSSEASPGWERLRELATKLEPFTVWTPGITPSKRVTERGIYVDAAYF